MTTVAEQTTVSLDRSTMLEQIRDKSGPWDIVIIGGGASGLGAAVDAASRGYSTLLLEQVDFSKGTSSRSTKLVHGGVRYLEQGNIKLVLEALYERGLLLKNAPHLVHDQTFVVPAYSYFQMAFFGAGLKTYDLLARKLSFGKSLLLSRREAIERIPNLDPKGLKGGILYHDGQFDDSRLALNLAQTAAEHGVVLINYMPVTGLVKTEGRVTGVEAQDLESGETFRIPAKVVINATGPFADSIRKMDDPAAQKTISASQGIHLVLDRSFLAGDTAIMVPKTDDGRVLFAIPWHDHVVVGTTDTPIADITLEPRPLQEEIDFVLSHARRYMTKDPQPSDVLSVFVGIRPLVSNPEATTTAAISRDHSLFVSQGNLVTICGGKWTTYRRMAEDTVNKAAEVAGLEKRPAGTKDMRVHGYVPKPLDDHRLAVYGYDADALVALERSAPQLVERIHPNLPVTRGQIVWAARYEMARTVEDALSRRTRALLLGAKASEEAAPLVAELMAQELGRDEAWQEAQVGEFQELAKQYQLEDATALP